MGILLFVFICFIIGLMFPSKNIANSKVKSDVPKETVVQKQNYNEEIKLLAVGALVAIYLAKNK